MKDTQRNALGTLVDYQREAIESVLYLDRCNEGDEARLDSVSDSIGLYMMIQPVGLVLERCGKLEVFATDRANRLMELLNSLGAWDRTSGSYVETIQFVATRTHYLSEHSLDVLNFYPRFSWGSGRGARGMRLFRRLTGDGVMWKTKYGWRELNQMLGLQWLPLASCSGNAHVDDLAGGGGVPRIGPAERGPWQQDREAVRGSSGDSPELVPSFSPTPVAASETADFAII